MKENIKVMLTTEGTYPHHTGGVSTWCNGLVKNLEQVDYVVYSVIMNPHINQQYELYGSDLVTVPLWGTDEPFEHLKTPFSQVFRARTATTESIISEKFIPVFREIVVDILSEEKNPIQLGDLLLELYHYFRQYDYKETFKSEITWNAFQEIVLQETANKGNKIEQPTVFAIIQSLGWLYRFFTILATPIPKVDVCHSAAAAFSGIPCVLSKLINDTPYLLTEHGVYLREQYLSLGKREYSSYLNTFFIRLIKSIVKLNYAHADQVSPVCFYNTRWEKKFGVMPEKIKVIHNGVDKEYFQAEKKKEKDSKLKVVSVARIDPVKDLVSLIKAAEIVLKSTDNVSFHVYGATTVPEYYDECIDLVKKLKLESNFIFEGHTDDIVKAYASGDVIVLSSITEAFPYSVVEAMMVGKAIVATDVGGVSEALLDHGILVPPRQYDEMAKGITKLLEDEELRISYEEKSKVRALEMFNLDENVNKYYESYIELRDRTQIVNIENEKVKREKLISDKASAMIAIDKFDEVVALLRDVIKKNPTAENVPDMLNTLSYAYYKLGKFDIAAIEKEKAAYIKKLQDEAKSA